MAGIRHVEEAGPSWFSSLAPTPDDDPTTPPLADAFARLWRGFMTTRVMLAAALLTIQVSLYNMANAMTLWLVVLCALYLAEASAVRLLAKPRPPGHRFDGQWAVTAAVDLLVFSVLQAAQSANISYTPVFALPVLMVSVLGTAMLAGGTAALATLLLLADALWFSRPGSPGEQAARLLQAGLTGFGLLVVAFLTNQLAVRLAREEATAQRNRKAAQTQLQINEVVIENLSDGVLVVRHDHWVSAANPASHTLIGDNGALPAVPFSLMENPGWFPLVDVVRKTLSTHSNQNVDLDLRAESGQTSSLRVRSCLSPGAGDAGNDLCVLFLQDRREIEARIRTEKLAAMGRVSAAVAHEIRNPLAAISQANALLLEELADTTQRRLASIVQSQSQRLAATVDDILDVVRIDHQDMTYPQPLPLDELVLTICSEWRLSCGLPTILETHLHANGTTVLFRPEHLRRVLVNLLDNAARHGDPTVPIRVVTEQLTGRCELAVWSGGPPLDASVERHLFEPFFSSNSRSSGLGLYICRELSSRYGAGIQYRRRPFDDSGGLVTGNEFCLTMTDPSGRFGAPLQ